MAETCESCGQPLKPPPEITRAPTRDPSVPCPDCGCRWLYINLTGECYECGRNIGGYPSRLVSGKTA